MKTTYVSPRVIAYGPVSDVVQFRIFGNKRDFWFGRRFVWLPL